MWEDILLSVGMSISESIGVGLVKQKKKMELLKTLEIEISRQFDEFADSSLDCNDFYTLVQSRKFIEIIRNLFLSINDGMDRSQYIERVEQYIYDECRGVNHNEVRDFIKKIEELYKGYLHKIIEDNPEIYALFQLMTISHREIIARIIDSEENIKRYFKSLEYNKIEINDEDIQLYHQVSEKEYGIIRFTGISGAERKKEQNINEFYVENTFSYYGKEIEKLFRYKSDDFETIRLENFFDFGNKIVLIGGAGFGKSTSLNYLFCNYEKMYRSYALKIKIDLKEYAKDIGEKKKGLLWCIAKEFSRKIKNTKLKIGEIQANLADYLDNGKCLVILDALDEIPTLPIRNKVRDEIANFCEVYYLNKFIISTREAGYLRNRFDDTFLHIKINQFNIGQIQKYSNNWYKSYYEEQNDFDEFWKKFEQEIKHARCENIISNPIMLVLALIIFDVGKNLPTKRIEFYQKCVDTFLTEREFVRATAILGENTKSILMMNLVVPKIAYYKFERINENVGYKFNSLELEKAVFNAIGVSDADIINWGIAVKEYIKYLVERTELVQEIDEDLYDFAHKTFYEYFLAFYFCKMYENEELADLLGKWIGDSNYDELARLIIEEVIQDNNPRQHDYIMQYLFEQLKLPSVNDKGINSKMDIFSIIVDLYNHNMIQPKFYMDYNYFILYNSKFVERINEGITWHNMRSSQRVQYNARILAELFQKAFINKENMIDAMDTLLYLNKDYKRQIIDMVEKDQKEYLEHIISLLDYTREVSGHIREIRKLSKQENIEMDLYKNELNYFLNEGIDYLLTYPQIYLSVINLSMLLNIDIDVEKFLNSKFGPNQKFYDYTCVEMLFRLVHKACGSAKYFLLFFVTIVKCLNKGVNRIFEYIFDERYYDREQITEKEIKLFYTIWEILDKVEGYEHFKESLTKLDLYEKKYDFHYKETYMLYLQDDKGKHNLRVKRILAENEIEKKAGK